jgi:hypothetical protein
MDGEAKEEVSTLKRKVDDLFELHPVVCAEVCTDYSDSKKRQKAEWQRLCETLTRAVTQKAVSPYPRLLQGLPFELVSRVLAFLLPNQIHDSFAILKKEMALTLAWLPLVSTTFYGWFPRHLVKVILGRFQPTPGNPLTLTRLRQATDRTCVTQAITLLINQMNGWLKRCPHDRIFFGKAGKDLLLPPPALDLLQFDYQYVGRNREGLSTPSMGAAWLALSVNGPVEGWLTTEDKELHALNRPVQVVAWEQARRVAMEREKSATAARTTARALTKRSLHTLIRNSNRLSIVSVKGTRVYLEILREPWPSVLTPQWTSNLERRLLEAVYWSQIGSELRILEQQINWAYQCLFSTLFDSGEPSVKEQTLLELHQFSNWAAADELLVLFLAGGNARNITDFTEAGVAMRTAETLLQRIERVHRLAMEVQGCEPWHQTAETGVRLDHELSWLQMSVDPDWVWVEEAWEALVFDYIVPMGSRDSGDWEVMVGQVKNLPAVLKITAMRAHNHERQYLMQVMSPLILANSKLDHLLETFSLDPGCLDLVQQALKVRSRSGVDALLAKAGPCISWWKEAAPSACAELQKICQVLINRPEKCSCKNAAALACTNHLCGSCCPGCKRHKK